jgi:hypothetical protein
VDLPLHWSLSCGEWDERSQNDGCCEWQELSSHKRRLAPENIIQNLCPGSTRILTDQAKID